MIADQQTNFLYLADTLPNFYPAFYTRFEKVLKQSNIPFALLPNTRDVWAVDYMPVQTELNSFVRFTYRPCYLKTKKEKDSISDTDSICEQLRISVIKSELLLDGGNVVKWNDKVILTERVFVENGKHSQSKVIDELELLFETDKVCLIPEQPNDFTGHADGMVRFLNNNTVLINDLKKENPGFRTKLLKALDDAGLSYISIPYNPYGNKNYTQANGCYINYLQMENIVFVPTFEIKEDEQVIALFEELFRGQTVITIDSREIANEGGILNCITWNIKKEHPSST